MIQLLNKLKKNQKGFTLVELIVVLVILAILAAFTIPAMLGFVNDAKTKAEIANAREVYVAAQASASQLAAEGKTPSWDGNGGTLLAQMNTLITGDLTITAAVENGVKDQGAVFVSVTSAGKVSYIIYGGEQKNIKITAGTGSGTGTEIVDKPTT